MVSVKYSGPMSESSGYSSANRNIVQALHEAKVDLVTEFQYYADNPTDYGEQLEIAKSYQNKHANYPIKVLHITPNVYQKHKEKFKYNVGHLFWETTKISDHWAWYLNEVVEIWTGCQENVDTFREAGFNGKIFKFPQPINTTRTEKANSIDSSRGFIFGSIFQWIERKNPKALLEAYWREFQDEDNVTLVIKTYGLSFKPAEAKRIYNDIDKWKKELGLPTYPRVLIIDYLLSDKEIHELHESFDCFVSAHRFEGWGVPQAEALAHGKPVISTNKGGIHEWISDEGMLKVGYTMVDVGNNMNWAEQYIKKGNKWAEINPKELREKMRFVFDNRDEAKKIGLKGQREAKEKLNFKTTGNMMKGRLQEIYKEQGF